MASTRTSSPTKRCLQNDVCKIISYPLAPYGFCQLVPTLQGSHSEILKPLSQNSIPFLWSVSGGGNTAESPPCQLQLPDLHNVKYGVYFFFPMYTDFQEFQPNTSLDLQIQSLFQSLHCLPWKLLLKLFHCLEQLHIDQTKREHVCVTVTSRLGHFPEKTIRFQLSHEFIIQYRD